MKRDTLGKLTPVVQKKLLNAIKAGNYITVSARYAGIHPNTFHRWMKRGREAQSGAYRKFFEAVKEAETYAEVRAVAIIQQQMEDNWRAAVAYLERKFPKRWSPREKRESSSGADTKPAGKRYEHQYDESQLAQVVRVLHEIGAIELPPEDGADPPDS